MMAQINIEFKINTEDYVRWLNDVPQRIQREIEEDIPVLRRNTKKIVQSKLKKGNGVDEGIYRKSFIINNFAESKWHIGFQVFAKKPHYRLTHLLEDGHRIKVFTRGKGVKTYNGNIGMSFVKTRMRPSGVTKSIKHIEPGQEYAEEQLPILYRKSYTKILTERMIKK